MTQGTITLAPTDTMVSAYKDAYNQTIRQIESDLRHGRIPNFDGEIERLQSVVLNGRPADSGRMAAYSDYRSIMMGSVSAPSGHPYVSFAAQAGVGATIGSTAYPTADITFSVTENGRTRTTILSGAIDASRLSDADRERLAADPNYTQRHLYVTDRTPGHSGEYRDVTYFIPVARHPVAQARRPLLAKQ